MKRVFKQGLLLKTYVHLYNMTDEAFAGYICMSPYALQLLYAKTFFDDIEKEKIEYVLDFCIEQMMEDPYVCGEYEKAYEVFLQERDVRIADGERILVSVGYTFKK